MWRFPWVYNFRLLSHQKWSLYRSGSRTGFSTNEFVRLVTSIRSAHSTSSPNTAWFNVESAAESKPLWSVDQPVTELTSFDDFGILSLGRGVSTETISTIGEKSFLDHLLKSGSSSNVPDLEVNYIPTTVGTGDLGGDFGSIEQLEMLQSEGYDVSTVIDEFRASESVDVPPVMDAEPERPAIFRPPVSREVDEEELESSLPFLMSRMVPTTSSTSGMSSIPTIPFGSLAVPTRRKMNEEERSARIKHCRTIAPATYTTLSATSLTSAQPESIPTSPLPNISAPSSSFEPMEHVSPSTSTVSPPAPSRFYPPGDRFLVASPEELMEATMAQDASLLRSLLHTKQWPESGFDKSAVFEFIVEKSADTDEALMFFRDFATSNRRSFVADKHIISLATRAVDEAGVAEAQKILSLARNMFMSRAPQSRTRSAKKYLEKLYSSALAKGTLSETQQLVETILEKQFDNDSQQFLRSATEMLATRRDPFSSVFSTWSSLSLRFGSTEAIDLIWECALGNTGCSEKDYAKQIGRILAHSRAFDHPFSVLAEMICAFLRLDMVDQASAVFSKVSVSGRHFRRPLSRLMSSSTLSDSDLQKSLRDVERLADLVTQCMYGERRRGGRSKPAEKQNVELAAEPKKPAISESVLSTLQEFCGLAGRKPQTKSPLKKNEKRKLHRVDEEQLHELSGNLQEAWIVLAQRSRDLASAERCLLWSQKNRVAISEKTVKKMEMLKVMNTNKEQSVEPFEND